MEHYTIGYKLNGERMEAMWEAINFILWKSQLVSIKHDRNEVDVRLT